MRRRVSTVALPRWGVMMTLGRARRGWSLGSGSGSVTSRAAAAMRFCDHRLRQCLRVDHRAASDIDQGGVGLHQGELARADAAAGLVG